MTEQFALPADPSREADERVALAGRLDALHDLLYRRGGVRPVNAAIDELCKLLLLRIHRERYPASSVSGISLSTLFDPQHVRLMGQQALGALRDAFTDANRTRTINGAPIAGVASSSKATRSGSQIRLC